MTAPMSEARVAEIEVAVDRAVSEVRALRFGRPAAPGPPVVEEILPLILPRIDDGPQAALDVLVETRRRMDRIEEQLAVTTSFRSLLHRRHAEVSDAADDAWAASVTSAGGHRRSASFGEAAPRERYAAADVATIDQRRAARVAQRALDHISTAVEVIRTAHFGIDKFRQDVHLVVRAMAVENALER